MALPRPHNFCIGMIDGIEPAHLFQIKIVDKRERASVIGMASSLYNLWFHIKDGTRIRQWPDTVTLIKRLEQLNTSSTPTS